MLSNLPRLAEPDQTAGVLQGEAGGDAAAGGAAVDLAGGEDADVGGGLLAPGVGAVGEDGAVEEGEIGIVGVGERHLRARGLGDGGRGIDERAGGAGADIEAEAGGRQHGVEGAAIADIEVDQAEAGHRHRGIEGEGEGRHALERDGAGLAVFDCDAGAHQAAGALDGDRRFRKPERHQAGIDGPAAERDDGVAAHGAVALVVHEEHGEIGRGLAGAGRIGRHGDDAVHIDVAARLEHEQAAEFIEPLARLAPLGEEGGSWNRRIARHDDAHRLPAGVHLDGLDGEGGGGWHGGSALLAYLKIEQDAAPPNLGGAFKLKFL